MFNLTTIHEGREKKTFTRLMTTYRARRSACIGWLGDLGYMMGDRSREERRTRELILAKA